MMKLLDHLEKRFRRFGVPHVTEVLIACQVAVYFLQSGSPEIVERAVLVPRLVLGGEVWRVLSFLLVPPLSNPIFAVFFWYLFYLMGTALEASWGVFRYNVYLLIGWLATVAAAFVLPDQQCSNGFLQGSVFLAFAALYPNFELLLFFLLPVKVKWLALLTWIYYFSVLVFDGWPMRLLVGASICNFLVFFGRDILRRMSTGRRRMSRQAERIVQRSKPLHTCRICGINNLTHPRAGFRYCSLCAGTCCYCGEHARNHAHVAAAAAEVMSEKQGGSRAPLGSAEGP
jgi:hypothetical protein